MSDLRFATPVAVLLLAIAAPKATALPGTDLPNIRETITGLETLREPAFIASCQSFGIRSVVLFTLGSHEGSFYEYRVTDGLMNNGGGFRLTHKSIDTMDLMGGIGTQAIERRIIRGLLKSSFRLVPAKAIGAFLLQHNGGACAAHWVDPPD